MLLTTYRLISSYTHNGDDTLQNVVLLCIKMFTRMAKPIRIIGDPDNQFPDQWSFALEFNIFYFLSVYGHVFMVIIWIFMI